MGKRSRSAAGKLSRTQEVAFRGAPADTAAADSHQEAAAADDVALEEMDAEAFMRGDFLDGEASAAALEPDLLSSSIYPQSDNDDDDDDKALDEDDTASNSDADSASDDDLDAEGHAAELAGLSQADPEFYEYLRAEEPALLDFDPADSEVHISCKQAIPLHKHQETRSCVHVQSRLRMT